MERKREKHSHFFRWIKLLGDTKILDQRPIVKRLGFGIMHPWS